MSQPTSTSTDWVTTCSCLPGPKLWRQVRQRQSTRKQKLWMKIKSELNGYLFVFNSAFSEWVWRLEEFLRSTCVHRRTQVLNWGGLASQLITSCLACAIWLHLSPLIMSFVENLSDLREKLTSFGGSSWQFGPGPGSKLISYDVVNPGRVYIWTEISNLMLLIELKNFLAWCQHLSFLFIP